MSEIGRDDDGRCFGCGADIDHYLGCPDDPDPDYEAEAAYYSADNEYSVNLDPE